MVALQVADPLRAQQRRLLGGLDAFGHRAEAEAPGQADQMAQEDVALRAAARLRTKEPSILTMSTARICRCRSEVWPAPKSSSATRQPACRNASTNRADLLDVVEAAVSVISTTSRRARSGRLRSSEISDRSQGRSPAVSPEILKPSRTSGSVPSSSTRLSRT